MLTVRYLLRGKHKTKRRAYSHSFQALPHLLGLFSNEILVSGVFQFLDVRISRPHDDVPRTTQVQSVSAARTSIPQSIADLKHYTVASLIHQNSFETQSRGTGSARTADFDRHILCSITNAPHPSTNPSRQSINRCSDLTGTILKCELLLYY